MNDTNRDFDEDPGLTGERLSQNLRRLFSPGQADLSAVDRAVAEAARKHLAQLEKVPCLRSRRHANAELASTTCLRLRKHGTLRRWAVPLAAAAVITIGCVLWLGHGPATKINTGIAAEDVDHNGKVDIVDALQLARHVESGRGIERMWDFNGDGVVDRRDVDKLAFATVALGKGV
jgi:hypothetical protein